MGPVCYCKCIVDIYISELGQFSTEVRIVFLFSIMKAQVFQKQDIPRIHPVNHGPNLRSDTVRGKLDLLVQKPGKPFGCRSQAELLLPLTFGPSHMGADDDFCMFIQGIVNGRQHAPDSGVIGYITLFIEGNIKINPDQDFFLFYVKVSDIFH